MVPSLPKQSKTDWKRINAMSDEDIDYSDIPELEDAFFENAILKLPEEEKLYRVIKK